VTERFRRLNTGQMKVEMTFEDAKTYSRSWTISIDARLMPDTELLEFVCNENEKSSRHYTGDASADTARAVQLAPAVLTRYGGDYNAGPVGVLKVVNEAGSLALVLPSGGSGHATFARSEEDLFIPDLGVSIKFLKGPRGE
jgi:hypothetical protein